VDLTKLRLLILDVDGVLTDGHLYYGENGEIFKRFHVHDGHGIKALMKAGIQVALVSSRQTASVAARAKELGIKWVMQGASDKSENVRQLIAETGIAADYTAFMGDDVVDLPGMSACKFPIAVANARPEVKKIACYVTHAAGGYGAVREVADLILGIE